MSEDVKNINDFFDRLKDVVSEHHLDSCEADEYPCFECTCGWAPIIEDVKYFEALIAQIITEFHLVWRKR